MIRRPPVFCSTVVVKVTLALAAWVVASSVETAKRLQVPYGRAEHGARPVKRRAHTQNPRK